MAGKSAAKSASAKRSAARKNASSALKSSKAPKKPSAKSTGDLHDGKSAKPKLPQSVERKRKTPLHKGSNVPRGYLSGAVEEYHKQVESSRQQQASVFVESLKGIVKRLETLVSQNIAWWRDAVRKWADSPPRHKFSSMGDHAEDIILPVPLPVSLTFGEKVALLAAIFDSQTPEAGQINPWRAIPPLAKVEAKSRLGGRS
jgi:hypothetical protein